MNQPLTPQAVQSIEEISNRYGLSTHAVVTLLRAVAAGGGSTAQFCHPELGGNGQWMSGGITMVGDTVNHGLQSRVASLCQELSALLASCQVFAPSTSLASASSHSSASRSSSYAHAGPSANHGNRWWPGNLGQPSASGGQNDSQYAYFPQAHRLAVQQGGQVSVYDTLDHQISGITQQQGGSASLKVTSQHGTFSIATLPLVNPLPATARPAEPTRSAQPSAEPATKSAAQSQMSTDQILKALEQLGQLHQQGVLTHAEFETKKFELLARL